MKEALLFGDDPRLEGVFEFPGDSGDPNVLGGVVVSHPHPLYGGTMVQPVVHHVAKVCRSRGFATLRFNFRGVGKSEGSYDGVDERKDVRAAARYVEERLGEEAPVILAGYSYGARMSALAAMDMSDRPPAALVLVAFPVMFEHVLRPAHFDGLGAYEGPVLSLCGADDDIAPPAAVGRFLREAGLHPEEVVVSGTDHFFWDKHAELEAAVGAFLGHHFGAS